METRRAPADGPESRADARNHTQRHANVGVVSVEAVEAPEVVTSAWIDEQLADVFARCDVRPGLLEELAGIKQRRWWPEEMRFDEAAALAGEQAIVAAGHRPGGDRHADLDLGLQAPPRAVCRLCRSSSSRPRSRVPQLRPRERLPRLRQRDAPRRDGDRCRPDQYALIVDGEGSRHTQLATIARLRDSRLGHRRRVRRVREPHARLGCGGDGARQPGRQPHGAPFHRRRLACRDAAPPGLRWRPGSDDDRHQDPARRPGWCWLRKPGPRRLRSSAGSRTSRGTSCIRSARCTRACCALRSESTSHGRPSPSRLQGNIGPAAIPFTLAGSSRRSSAGERVLCMGMGSGLNASAAEIIW